ncbi:hypothetical protein Fot_38370 [Forsythia ovata]|uniref:Uncharacterized protein n=1 Tax=Forsythia ovata TaxID=205694 RepID=A0ABD1S1L5_9LAMI
MVRFIHKVSISGTSSVKDMQPIVEGKNLSSRLDFDLQNFGFSNLYGDAITYHPQKIPAPDQTYDKPSSTANAQKSPPSSPSPPPMPPSSLLVETPPLSPVPV